MNFNLQTKFEGLSEASTRITVVNVVNPNKFHIRLNSMKNVMEIMSMEIEMEKMFNSKENTEIYIPQKYEVVAAYQMMFQKFVRVVVEEVGDTENLYFNVWVIDYGFAAIIHDPSLFRKLPEKFKNSCSPIAEMCLAVQPIKNVNGVTTLASYTEWNQEALDNFNKNIRFSKQLKVDEYKLSLGILFGDILAKFENGQVISLKQFLIENNYAVDLDYSSNFVEELYTSSDTRREFFFRYEESLIEYIDIKVGKDKPVNKPPDNEPSSKIFLIKKTVRGKAVYETVLSPIAEEASGSIRRMTTEECRDYEDPLVNRFMKSMNLDSSEEPPKDEWLLPSTSSQGISKDSKTEEDDMMTD